MKLSLKNYYALICKCSKEPLVCGVFKDEYDARVLDRDLKDDTNCPAEHKIIKIKKGEMEI